MSESKYKTVWNTVDEKKQTMNIASNVLQYVHNEKNHDSVSLASQNSKIPSSPSSLYVLEWRDWEICALVHDCLDLMIPLTYIPYTVANRIPKRPTRIKNTHTIPILPPQPRYFLSSSSLYSWNHAIENQILPPQAHITVTQSPQLEKTQQSA